MKSQHLGDSFDLVKRIWAISLGSIAPLYAHTKFLPREIQATYREVTSIAAFDPALGGRFGVLFDPDTGILSPSDAKKNTPRSHVSLEFITEVNSKHHPTYMLSFDQSYHRKHKLQLTREQQRQAKMEFLRSKGIHSFYYVSHAPFVFMSEDKDVLHDIRQALRFVPSSRFESL